MGKKLTCLLKLNASDLRPVLGMVALPWLLVHVVTAGVMLLVRPDESIFISGILLPICVGVAVFMATSGNTMVTFSQAVKFSATRKTALKLTLLQTLLESALALALGLALLAFERNLAMPLWRVLSGNMGLLVDDFGYVWWAIPAGFAAGYLIGLWYGTLVLRYSRKGFWLFYFLCIGSPAAMQLLPWKTHEVTNILIPVLIAALILSAVWSIWALLRLSITK